MMTIVGGRLFVKEWYLAKRTLDRRIAVGASRDRSFATVRSERLGELREGHRAVRDDVPIQADLHDIVAFLHRFPYLQDRVRKSLLPNKEGFHRGVGATNPARSLDDRQV